ncbi:fungal-specific transcription factor domain-containing protein [Lipomyces arxii]|uniref:fungal-specific transcription factor domain-containing protein n=1 Tax=Lipomyces arxii TaxID=56418 RepID=UPI0034CEDB7C
MFVSSGTEPVLESRRVAKPRRVIRSKTGCLTCLRRKVKCDETKATCGSCSRLALECQWRLTDRRSVSVDDSDGRVNRDSGMDYHIARPDSSQSSTQRVEDFFNYASFMWTDSTVATPSVEQNPQQPYQAPFTNSVTANQSLESIFEASTSSVVVQQKPGQSEKGLDIRDSVFGLLTLLNSPSNGSPEYIDAISRSSSTDICGATTTVRSSKEEIVTALDNDRTVTGSSVLLNHFLTNVIPPIIVSVETESKWISLRKTLMLMAQSSTLVYNSILAFSELHYYRQSNRTPPLSTASVYYDNATREVEEILRTYKSNSVPDRTVLRNILSGLFFLSYVDLISEPGCERVNVAAKRLKDAFELVRSSKYGKISAIDFRLLSWLRLLDERAYTAGSDGLFLSEDSPTLYSEELDSDEGDDDVSKDANQSGLQSASSGASITESATKMKPQGKFVKDPETDIQDILYNLILQPGVVFFQKVQSFMCRITQIDRWHRSRGTVQDEFEVMKIADDITKDLRNLWDARPPLMDHAIQGFLTDAHLGAKLAQTVTLNFRVYMCNYFAAFVHLQRVAYVQYPSTPEVLHAVNTILVTAKQIEQGDGYLTASMLWPLVMCGSEIKDKDDRVWIVDKLRQLDRITANGKMTADVLEHVQNMQDQTGQRADIRAVMVQVYNSAFAIL